VTTSVLNADETTSASHAEGGLAPSYAEVAAGTCTDPRAADRAYGVTALNCVPLLAFVLDASKVLDQQFIGLLLYNCTITAGS
jgi:hypothetical protein